MVKHEDAPQHFPKPMQEPHRVAIIARRAHVLAALVCRGCIESGAGNVEAETVHQKVLAWLTASDLWSAMEPDEESTLRAPLGMLPEADVIRATWLAEGLAILAWALQQIDLPTHDVPVDPISVAESVGFLTERWDELTDAKPRSPTELQAYRELIYAIHARLRGFMRNRIPKDFSTWLEPSWMQILGVDASCLTVGNDLAVHGKSLAFADESNVVDCLHLTYERHKAILWLVEADTVYSQISADI